MYEGRSIRSIKPRGKTGRYEKNFPYEAKINGSISSSCSHRGEEICEEFKSECPRTADLILTRPLTSNAIFREVARIMKTFERNRQQHEEEENKKLMLEEEKRLADRRYHILIIDDDPTNLTVSKGLLEPLEMNIDTASSGMEAIDKISIKKYDMVFMDHMMPGMDGVETTRVIRRLHPSYQDVPIIALTANAVEGTKEQFLAEGMNDFVAKPIEFSSGSDSEHQIAIKGLDTESALSLLGSQELYMAALKDYYQLILPKAKRIKELEEAEEWDGYTIEVHALKSSSKQVGALELSEQAALLEAAGKARNIPLIRKRTDKMLELYVEYAKILRPFFEDESDSSENSPEATAELLKSLFEKMREALEELDMDKMDEVLAEFKSYSYPSNMQEYLNQLTLSVESLDVDSCMSILEFWEKEY